MADPTPSFIVRLVLAFRLFWRILVEADFAVTVAHQLNGRGTHRGTRQPAAEPPALREATPDAALQLLGLLQQEGRLVDFLEEDVARYADAEIGAAVRVVHEGCRKALHEYFTIMPVRDEAEGERVTLGPGFDASAIRPTGKVIGEPPFTGTLAHRGWRVTEVRLPKLGTDHDVKVLAPAEVEL